MALRVVEFNELAQDDKLSRAWSTLRDRCSDRSFFQSYIWFATQWRWLAAERSLRVLLVLDGDEPFGIVPLMVQKEPMRTGTMRVVTGLLEGWGSYYGPIGPQPRLTMQAALAHLRESRRDWDLIELRWLPPLSESPGTWDLVARAAGLPGQQHPWEQVAFVDLAGSWDDYWKLLDRQANRRRNVLRCERRLREQGDLRYVRYRPAGATGGESDPRWDLYDACEQIAQSSWQADLSEGNTICHDSVRGFMRDLHQVACESGNVDLSLLYIDDQPVAYVYGYQSGGYVDLVRVGYDARLAKLGPGNVIFKNLFCDSFARGDRVIDFGPVESYHSTFRAPYKHFWATRLEPSYRLVHYPVGVKPQVLRLGRWLERSWTQDVTVAAAATPTDL